MADTLSLVPRDAFNIICDFCSARELACFLRASRRFGRHLGAGGATTARPGLSGEKARYPWGARIDRMLRALPLSAFLDRASLAQETFVPGDLPLIEQLHMSRYLERLLAQTPVTVDGPHLPMRDSRSSSSDADVETNEGQGDEEAGRTASSPAHVPVTNLPAAAEFGLKVFSDTSGSMEPCSRELTTSFARQFEMDTIRTVIAALGYLCGTPSSFAVTPPPRGEAIIGPLPWAPWEGPSEHPLSTVLFPIHANRRSAVAAGAQGTDERDAAARGRGGVDGGEVPTYDDHDARLPHHVDPATRADPATSGPALYAPAQLRLYTNVLAHVLITKVQHYYSSFDWKRAIIGRVVGPTGRTAELRFFSMMRLGSFPCFRCQLIWMPGNWASGDALAIRFNDDPHEPQVLFECGYGRVEMDIRPRFAKAQWDLLAATLDVAGKLPLELLWNVIVATLVGNVLTEHVPYLNVQYRSTVRTAFAHDLLL
jgi:hypothetical protein